MTTGCSERAKERMLDSLVEHHFGSWVDLLAESALESDDDAAVFFDWYCEHGFDITPPKMDVERVNARAARRWLGVIELVDETNALLCDVLLKPIVRTSLSLSTIPREEGSSCVRSGTVSSANLYVLGYLVGEVDLKLDSRTVVTGMVVSVGQLSFGW